MPSLKILLRLAAIVGFGLALTGCYYHAAVSKATNPIPRTIKAMATVTGKSSVTGTAITVHIAAGIIRLR